MKTIFFLLSAILLGPATLHASSVCTLNAELTGDGDSSLIYSILLDGNQFTSKTNFFDNAVIDIRELEAQSICKIPATTCSLAIKKISDHSFTYAVEMNKKRITNWSYLTNSVISMREMVSGEYPICTTTASSVCRVDARDFSGSFYYSVSLNNEQITEWSFLGNTIEKRNILVNYDVCTL